MAQSSSHKSPIDRMSQWQRVLLFLILWAVIIYMFRANAQPGPVDLSFTEFKEKVRAGAVTEVTFRGRDVTGILTDGSADAEKDSGGRPSDGGDTADGTDGRSASGEGAEAAPREFQTVVPPLANEALIDLLEENEVTIRAESQERGWLTTLLASLLPWVLLIGFFIYTSRKLQERMGGGGPGGGIFGFGKSKAKVFQKAESEVSYDDVAGLANPKKDLQEIVGFLKDPTGYREVGAELPRGILLVGPPGTGKTLMARATAGEADVPFFSISGSEFIEMFVGVGASRVRDMFDQAKKESPAIIFIDEMDSIGRARGTGVGGGHDEREQTLNQILNEMDGFSPQESVVVIAATNRPDVLDPALIRPGRFDRRVTLDLPQKNAREAILEVHGRDVQLADDVDLEAVARRTVGFSGADLKNLVNESALLAARKGQTEVTAAEIDAARDKIIMGMEREDLISDDEKAVVAYHEAGHALMARLLPGADPIKKVTIIPRGRSLGATEQIPEENRYNLKKSYLLNRVAILLGGRAAERIRFDDTTTGAGDDLKKTTQLVRRMVCQWGMSDTLGSVVFQQGEPHPFLGKEMAEPRDHSEATAKMIDDEIRRIVREGEEMAVERLTEHRADLDALAEALLDRETLTDEEIDELLPEAN